MLTKKTYTAVTASVFAAMLLAVAGCDQKEAPTPVSDPATGTPPVSRADSSAPSPSVGTTIDDTAITTKVKSAFIADPEVKSLDITAETRKGEVQLSGYVENEAQVSRATEVARTVEGVKAVDNKMSLSR